MPKVSIIIPAYNVENYVCNGLDSVIQQTESNIEIIIVDDGSTDRTFDVIMNYANKDKRIIVIKQKNQGVSVARNAALDIASGDYVIFLDSDDWLAKDTIETLLSKNTESDEELVCCDCFYVDLAEDGGFISKSQVKKNEIKVISANEVLELIGSQSSFRLNSSCYKLFSRRIIEENNLRFEKGIHQGEDGLFTFQYINSIKKVKYIPIPLWYILNRPGSATTSQYSEKWKSAIIAIDKMLSYQNITEKARNSLITYRTSRAMWIEINCLRSNNKNKRDVDFAKRILKKNYRYIFNRNKSLKSRLQYIILTLLPYRLLVVVLKISERK